MVAIIEKLQTAGDSSRTIIRSFVNKWSKGRIKDKLNLLAKSYNHMNRQLDGQEDIDVYFRYCIEIGSRIWLNLYTTDHPNADDLRIFIAFVEFTLTELKLKRLMCLDITAFQKEISRQINGTWCTECSALNDIKFTKYLYKYMKFEEYVISSGLNGPNSCQNCQNCQFQFELKESATYHWRKHSIDEKYDHNINKKPAFSTPCEYLNEANYELNHRLIVYFEDKIYCEHHRFTEDEKGFLKTYYKVPLNWIQKLWLEYFNE